MKKPILITILPFLLFLQLGAKAQIANGDFTNWSLDSLGRLDPDNWDCSNLMYDNPTIVQDVDRLGGSGYSVKFVCVYDSSIGNYRSGELLNTHIPYSGARPVSLSGYWKLYDPFFTDQMTIELKFYNAANQKIGSADAGTPLAGSIPNWTNFNQTINYTTNDPIDNYTLNLVFFALAHDSTVNAHLDDLAFDLGTSIEKTDLTLNSSVRCLNRGLYNLELSNQKEFTDIKLFDLTGKMIQNIFEGNSPAGINNYKIDLSELQSGIYLCRIHNGSSSQTIKLINE